MKRLKTETFVVNACNKSNKLHCFIYVCIIHPNVQLYTKKKFLQNVSKKGRVLIKLPELLVSVYPSLDEKDS